MGLLGYAGAVSQPNPSIVSSDLVLASSLVPAPQSSSAIGGLVPEIARFAIRGRDLPKLTHVLPFAEWFRQALMSASQRVTGAPHAAAVFSGKDADGNRLKGKHRHAFVLPTDDDDDGCVDHVTVYAPEGFDAAARLALQQVQVLFRGHHHPEVWCVLLGVGPVAAMTGTVAEAPAGRPSRRWCSRTPFMLPRHAKGPDREDAPTQLRRELANRDWPEPIAIRPLPGTMVAGRFLPWEHFHKVRRSGHGSLGHQAGLGFRIAFAEPVDPARHGLLAIGYACHFGLGQFVPEAGSDDQMSGL